MLTYAGIRENSVHSVPVPPSYFSRFARRVISFSAGGFIQFVGEDEHCGVVQAAQPVTASDNYIEVLNPKP